MGKKQLKKSISKEEQELRKEAVEYANASMYLEGFGLSPEMMRLQQLYIDGKIDINELLEEYVSEEK